MIIVLHKNKVFIWGIPSLSPHSPDVFNDNPTHIPPLLKTSLPDDITCNYERIEWENIFDWYAGPLQSIHLGHLGVSTKVLDIRDVEIVIKPDLSDISLHVIDTHRLAPHFDTILWPKYHIFEDHTHVSQGHIVHDDKDRIWIYMRSTSRPPNILPESPRILRLSLPEVREGPSSCPASGRFVYSVDKNNCNEIVVADFLKYV